MVVIEIDFITDLNNSWKWQWQASLDFVLFVPHLNIIIAIC